jgi:hypothetical protein
VTLPALSIWMKAFGANRPGGFARVAPDYRFTGRNLLLILALSLILSLTQGRQAEAEQQATARRRADRGAELQKGAARQT